MFLRAIIVSFRPKESLSGHGSVTGNYPVILMVKPDCVMVQEIKSIPAKAKIMDMVAIRHPSSNSDHRTTLILLCEDGSLRIYMAAMDQTGSWPFRQFSNCLLGLVFYFLLVCSNFILFYEIIQLK